MLVNAYSREDEIRKACYEIWYDERYQWFFSGEHYRYSLGDGDRNGRHFASVDKNGNLVGIIGYDVHSEANWARGLYVLRFPDGDPLVLGRDLKQAVDDVFNKFGHNRLSFNVVTGNPAERMYDKWVPRLGGYVEGVKRESVVDMAGNLCDSKEYVIFRPEYLLATRNDDTPKKEKKSPVPVLTANRLSEAIEKDYSDWGHFHYDYWLYYKYGDIQIPFRNVQDWHFTQDEDGRDIVIITMVGNALTSKEGLALARELGAVVEILQSMADGAISVKGEGENGEVVFTIFPSNWELVDRNAASA